MKLIMENWNRYLNEIGMSQAATGLSSDEYKKATASVQGRIQDLTAREIYDIISMIDPTQITAWPEAALGINNFRKDPSWWNAGMVSLSLLAIIPVLGKLAKGGKAAVLAKKIKKTGDEVAVGLKKFDEPAAAKLANKIDSKTAVSKKTSKKPTKPSNINTSTIDLSRLPEGQRHIQVHNHITGKIYDRHGAFKKGEIILFRGVKGKYDPMRSGMSRKGTQTQFFSDDSSEALKYAMGRGSNEGTVIAIKVPMEKIADYVNWRSVMSNMQGINSEIPTELVQSLISKGYGEVVRIVY